ncbi:hypothetical protein LINPERPRIM_LOCUS41671 [Linum perenne]
MKRSSNENTLSMTTLVHQKRFFRSARSSYDLGRSQRWIILKCGVSVEEW